MGHSRLDPSERGQTIAMVAVFMTVLLGMSALAIDLGVWYQSKRQLQSTAEASALAGGAFVPVSWTSAQTAAAYQFSANAKPGTTVTYQQATSYSPNDSILVTVERDESGFFSKVFGIDTVEVRASARVAMQHSNGGAMPWGVMRDTYTPGQSYSIYVDNSSPNNGALRLDVWNGSSCGVYLGGSADYRADIEGKNIVCPLHIGDLIDPKTGQNSGPTRQGIDTRITTFQPVSSIATFSNGVATVLQPNAPQLVLVPIIENAQTGGTTWPNGSGKVRVVSFAWFIITGYGDNGKRVDGVFVATSQSDPSASNNGAPTTYTPIMTG